MKLKLRVKSFFENNSIIITEYQVKTKPEKQLEWIRFDGKVGYYGYGYPEMNFINCRVYYET